MANYISKLRRGWKNTNANGEVVRDDWAEYEQDPNHVKPLGGELVIEYDNGVPRLKIGDGEKEFSALPYISVDSFIIKQSAPKTIKITLDKNGWLQAKDSYGNNIEKRYYQNISIADITPNSKVDLQPSPEQLIIFHNKDLTFTTVNENGNIRVCAIGQKPTDTYTMQATVKEVIIDG